MANDVSLVATTPATTAAGRLAAAVVAGVVATVCNLAAWDFLCAKADTATKAMRKSIPTDRPTASPTLVLPVYEENNTLTKYFQLC